MLIKTISFYLGCIWRRLNRKHLAICLNNKSCRLPNIYSMTTIEPTISHTFIPLILVYRLVYLLYGCFSEKRNCNWENTSIRLSHRQVCGQCSFVCLFSFVYFVCVGIEVRGKSSTVWAWGLNSGSQAWQQMPLPTELSLELHSHHSHD